MKQKKRKKIACYVTVLVMMLGMFNIPLIGYAEVEAPVTVDAANKMLYANGNTIEIWEAAPEQKALGNDLEITVLDNSAEEYTVKETYYIPGDYTIYGGSVSGTCEISDINMYGGHVKTLVVGGKADSIDNEESGIIAHAAIYGGQVDTIKFVENGYIYSASVFINDMGDDCAFVSNIIVGSASGETGKFNQINIEGVSHPSAINITPGYCGGKTLQEAMADFDDWKTISITGKNFTGLEAFKSISNCTINGVENTFGPAEGTVVKDAGNTAKYEVAESDGSRVEVVYKKPVKKKANVTIPASVTLADGTKGKVTAVDDKAFKNDRKIKNVIIGKNVEEIGKEAFSGCKKLTKVTMGKNVEKIGNSAFAKCTSLKNVTLPTDIEKIGVKAFYGSKNLKKITIKSKKLKSSKVGKQAFKGVYAKAKIDVPNNKVKAYKKFFYKKGLSKKAKIS